MPIPRFPAALLWVGVSLLGTSLVSAQEYPHKPIRIITTAAGGGNDFVARLIAQGIAGPLGQPVIVDNRGTSILAAEAASKAPPDGYTLSVAGGGLWTIPLLQQVPYDPVRDFVPITLVMSSPSILAVHPALPVRSVKELIALAKSRPGELNYGSSGTGTSGNLAAELFKAMAGVNIVHIPYKGTAPSIMAVISGEAQVTIYDAGLVGPHVKSGKLKALAVTSAEPSQLAPGLPTVAASGLPGYEAVSMTGLFAPGKTPPAIVNRLNHEMVRVIQLPDVKERFLNAGSEPIGNSPEQFAVIIKADMARVGKVIKDAGIRAQ